MSYKLNLGCGNKQIEGFIGVDRFFCKGVDIIADIENLPFKESIIDEVLLDNVIEHILDISKAMQEIYRITKNNSLVKIRTPHFTSLSSWRDPTHVHHFSYFSIDYFIKESTSHYMGVKFKLVHRELNFGGIWSLIGKMIFLLSPKIFEKYFCFIFRAGTLTFKIRTVKEDNSGF